MGFEQLAALRAQLASAKAAAEPATPPAPSLTVGMGPPSRRPPRAPRPPAPALSVGAVIGRLQQRFPEAFPRKPAPKLPLKVGILADLAAQAGALGLTEDQLRAALGTWCRGQRYWAGLAAGAARVDLTGAAAGTVTEQEAAWAHQQASRHMRPEGARKMPARNGDAPASDAG
ncbi:ProQ/FinO family protein (plasmid) [Cupriavidus necator]|nr:ProQ/FinO family protein [Cupriavidus necator]